MRNYLLFIVLFQFFFCAAQTDTEVYLFDISSDKNELKISNKRNISNNKGYDNQPSFYNDNIVLYASTKAGQTDIAKYNIRDNKTEWISSTLQGSEYSPIKIPNQKAISSIRLDTTGKQLLYQYDFKTGNPKVLLENLVVGYHCWYNKDIIVSSVLEDKGLSLVVSNLENKKNTTFQKKIGRSLHKIPNTNLISYVSKENEQWEIKSLDPISGETKKITNTIPGAEDMCWLLNGTILMPKGNIIYKFNPKTDNRWSAFHTFSDPEIGNITRIATNSINSLLTLVSDISPEHIVQQQLDAYNSRDIDAFTATFSENVKVYYYPNKLSYEGKENLKKGYAPFFENTPDLHCDITNRIVYGNKVIDEELVLINGEKIKAVAIYEVENGKIAKVTFL
ncbi:nuclear transport factor 2 family protein [Aquimarina litoralis]|uniref:nuclear transport factor 2 family protein n=1 Tax=Aquimarina litoralis TaxID=584605 RepID=UPI001C597442|nr:nuclear transport factor 2 family protein [Aquimarina litoralis]MBW1295702.1 steroid delta-isomerase [Aquimarina litoralis]